MKILSQKYAPVCMCRQMNTHTHTHTRTHRVKHPSILWGHRTLWKLNRSLQTLSQKNEQGTFSPQLALAFREFWNPLRVYCHYRLKANPTQLCCNEHRCLGCGVWQGKVCALPRCTLWPESLCLVSTLWTSVLSSQGSVSVLAKASPAPNYSSSSPPSSRTSPWPALWPLRTSTLLPRRVGWATCPQNTRSGSCPVKGAEGRRLRMPGSYASPPLQRMVPEPSPCLLASGQAVLWASIPPLHRCHLHGKVPSVSHLLPSLCSSSKLKEVFSFHLLIEFHKWCIHTYIYLAK